jgi:hypothetical protein
MKESGIGWTRLEREINAAGVDKFLHDAHGSRSVHRVTESSMDCSPGFGQSERWRRSAYTSQAQTLTGPTAAFLCQRI